MSIKTNKASEYAKWCVEPANRKVGTYIKKQAESWLRVADGEDAEAFVDEAAIERVSKLLKVITHPDLGCPMYEGMERYAWFLIIATLCTKKKRFRKQGYSVLRDCFAGNQQKELQDLLLGGAVYSSAIDRTKIFKIILGGPGSEAFQ